MLIFFFAHISSSLAAVASPYTVSDANGLGSKLDAWGAISGGGGCSRFLIEYPEPQRSQILDYLFLPNYGASLQALKFEIGGDADSTNGAEACYSRYEGEANFSRGYEVYIAQEAKKRNPNIILYALPWTWPNYLAGTSESVGDGRGNPWGNLTKTANYVTTYLRGLKDSFGLEVSYVGLWNEVGYNLSYIPVLRSSLDAAGLSQTLIVAADMCCSFGIADSLLDPRTPPEVRAAVSVLGAHYPGSSSSPAAQSMGLPMWASEDSSEGGVPGGECTARALNENYVHGHLTASFNWALVSAFYRGIRWYGSMLMDAGEPWSGNYVVNPGVWAMAHYTQMTAPGWLYLQHGAGVGYLQGGGTYTTLVSPQGVAGGLTLVIEKMDRATSACDYSRPPPNTTTSETATFQLGGTLLTTTPPITSLYAWRSDFSSGSPGDGDLFQPMAPIPVVAGAFSLAVGVGQVFTLSTLGVGRHGEAPSPPPASAPFPLPYFDSFNGSTPSTAHYTPGGMPRFWSNINGGFELGWDDTSGSGSGSGSGGGRGLVLQLATRGKPVLWVVDSSRPVTVLGDAGAWRDIQASVDVSIRGGGVGGGGVVVGVRCSGDQDALPGILLSLGTGGDWNVTRSLHSIAGGGNGSDVVASGRVPGGVPPGTWHTIGAVVRGGNASFTLDGTPLVTSLNVSQGFPTSGWVALGGVSWEDEVWYSNAGVSPLPDLCSAAPAPTGTPLTLRACDSTPASGGANGNKAFAFVPAPAAASAAAGFGGQMGTLRPLSNPGICLQGHANSLVDSTPCNATLPAQLWSIVGNASSSSSSRVRGGDSGVVRVENALGGNCLESAGQNTAPGTVVDVWPCHYGTNPIDTNQLWVFNETSGELVNALSKLCASLCLE